jgi:hypothetical protein
MAKRHRRRLVRGAARTAHQRLVADDVPGTERVVNPVQRDAQLRTAEELIENGLGIQPSATLTKTQAVSVCFE